MDLHSARTVANLSLLLSCLQNRSFYFDISVIIDVGRYKRGEALSSVIGTQVQTSCNPQKSLCNYYRCLGFRCWQRHSCNVESWCKNSFGDRLNTVFDNSFFLLHRNFLQDSSSPNSSPSHYPRTRESNTGVRYITIQKDSFHRTVAAVGFGSLLFSTYASGAIRVSRDWKHTVISFVFSIVFYNNVNVFQFHLKPNFVLLEDKRGQRDSEGHVFLFLNTAEIAFPSSNSYLKWMKKWRKAACKMTEQWTLSSTNDKQKKYIVANGFWYLISATFNKELASQPFLLSSRRTSVA